MTPTNPPAADNGPGKPAAAGATLRTWLCAAYLFAVVPLAVVAFAVAVIGR